MKKGIKIFLAVLIASYLILVFVVDYGSSDSKGDHQIENEKLEQAKEEDPTRRSADGNLFKQEKGIEQSVDSSIKNFTLKKEEIYETK